MCNMIFKKIHKLWIFIGQGNLWIINATGIKAIYVIIDIYFYGENLECS